MKKFIYWLLEHERIVKFTEFLMENPKWEFAFIVTECVVTTILIQALLSIVEHWLLS